MENKFTAFARTKCIVAFIFRHEQTAAQLICNEKSIMVFIQTFFDGAIMSYNSCSKQKTKAWIHSYGIRFMKLQYKNFTCLCCKSVEKCQGCYSMQRGFLVYARHFSKWTPTIHRPKSLMYICHHAWHGVSISHGHKTFRLAQIIYKLYLN